MTAKSRKRALFIVNPNARNGRKPINSIRQSLESGGLTLIDAVPAEGETLSDVISRMREACDLVIIGGGDGTLNAAAAGLVDTGLPLAVLPLGTANDFARTIGLPADPLEAASLILSAQPRFSDLGEVLPNASPVPFSKTQAAR